MKLSVLQKARKALAFLLTFALVLSAAAVITLPTAADTVDIWDGTAADGYAGGTGTAEDPYQIATPEQLARLVGVDVLGYSETIVNASRNKFYKLTADIYLNDVSDSRWYEKDGLNTWYTGTNSRFVGSLDGAGHTIRGLYFAADAGYAGLFPVIDAWEADRYFKNLTIADSYICGSSMAGAIAARAYGGNSHGFIFDRCYVTDTVVVHATKVGGTAPWCGGLVGYSTTGSATPYSFTDCAVLAKAKDGGRMKYGLIGINLTWSGSMSMSVRNSFACADDWQGLTLSGSTDGSYLVSAPETVRGDAAKTAMPNLDWDAVWMPTADGYPVYKAEEADVNGTVGAVWEGAVAKGYAGGTGTAEDPYLIETANQLAYLVKHDIIDLGGGNSSNTMGKYYKLAADIYLNNVADPDWKTHAPNSWYSSGSSARFGGNLDGDGYTIYGLYYDGAGAAGLISYADIWSYDITIQNVTLSDSYIKTSHSFAGGLIGFVYGTDATDRTLTVERCFVDDNVTVWSTNADGYVGGLVGCLHNKNKSHYTFADCGVLADIKGETWKNCAGLAIAGGAGVYRIERCFAFPRLVIDSYGNAYNNTDSHILAEQSSLLEIRGEQARTTMADFDWENSAFTPVKDSYPRLKLVSQRLGDLNCDDVCDTADLTFLQKHLLGVAAAAVFDANCDGASDILDLVDLKEKVDAFTGPDSAYVPAGYGLVWNDEFRGRTIDTAKWCTAPENNRMSGTDELGCFDDDTVRSVSNGGLKMTAMKNPFLSEGGYNGSQYITTTSISTENRMSFKYGYLEVKAKVPYKKGCWPSLWLRSPHAAQVEGETGLDGYNMEIDVIEPFGFTDKNRITIHETNKDDSDDHRQLATGDYTFDDAADLANEYHVYGFLWTESAMTFYVDGKEFASFSMEALRELGYVSSFDDTVNILFNNHLFTASGEFNGGDEDNIIENHEDSLPSAYVVDYIRLYQQENSGSVLLLR